MGKTALLPLACAILAFWSVYLVKAEDAYKYFTWTVTYGTASPLGVPQQVCNTHHFLVLMACFVGWIILKKKNVKTILPVPIRVESSPVQSSPVCVPFANF